MIGGKICHRTPKISTNLTRIAWWRKKSVCGAKTVKMFVQAGIGIGSLPWEKMNDKIFPVGLDLSGTLQQKLVGHVVKLLGAIAGKTTHLSMKEGIKFREVSRNCSTLNVKIVFVNN